MIKRVTAIPFFREIISVTAALYMGLVLILFSVSGTSSGAWLSAPAEGWKEKITSSYGQRENPFDGSEERHRGLDIGLPEGTEIYAAAEGVVSLASRSEFGYGYHLLVEHGDGYETLYAHCSALLKEEGERVKAGDVIALAGSTGESTGSHLHFELRKEGEGIDPQKYLKE